MLPETALLLRHKRGLEGRQRGPRAYLLRRGPGAAGHGGGHVTPRAPPGVAFVVCLAAEDRASHRKLHPRSSPQ